MPYDWIVEFRTKEDRILIRYEVLHQQAGKELKSMIVHEVKAR